jgi:hypothetical protein
MSDIKRFDETIVEEVKAAIDKLLLHKELSSVAVVLDWNLPGPAKQAFPVGMWKTTEPMGASFLCLSLVEFTKQLLKTSLLETRAALQSKTKVEDTSAEKSA